MNQNKSVYERKREFKRNFQHKQFSQEKTIIIAKQYKQNNQNYGDTNEFGCQYDSRRNHVTCLSDQILYPQTFQQKNYNSKGAKEVFTFGAEYNTEIGVSSIRALRRKKVKKIYLPETSDAKVGSSGSDLLPRKTSRRTTDVTIKKSSKCIGGLVEIKQPSLINAKISPIIKTKSGVTSPMSVRAKVEQQTNVDIPKIIHATSITVMKNAESDCKDLQPNAESAKLSMPVDLKEIHKTADTNTTDEMVTSVVQVTKSGSSKKGVKESSSNSLVQHVHDLESPCDDQQSYCNIIDPMENKLEREYRKMFSTKSNEKKQDEKLIVSNDRSTFRRRFDALRRSVRKDDAKNEYDTSKETFNTNENSSQKDASIVSDPPSLEARSFYEIKTFSPSTFHEQDNYLKPKSTFKKSSMFRKNSGLRDDRDTSKQGVKRMFKLWGKKFNLEEEANIRKSVLKKKSAYLEEVIPQEVDNNKEDKKYNFFKKKFKDKISTYHSPDGVTTGRCEVKDGLTITIGKNRHPTLKDVKRNKKEECNEITRQTWLQKFLTRATESKDRVHLRWNNNSYATSSSNTVLGLMNTIYKSNGVVIKSQGDLSGGSFYTRSVTKHSYNRKVEAWMVPHIMTFRQHFSRRKSNLINYYKSKNIGIKYSDRSYYHKKLEHFEGTDLHHVNRPEVCRQCSSNHFTMGISKCVLLDMGSDVKCGQTYQSSEEEVYEIIEYETPNSNYNFKRVNNIDDDVQNGDYLCNANTKSDAIKGNEVMDVHTQGSEKDLPERHDIVYARIITQKDTDVIRKSNLKFRSDASSDESNPSVHTAQNKCELSPKYLQEYYKHFTLLGVDFFSGCVSDSHITCCFENSKSSIYINDDNSKSCPNIYESYQTAVKISSIITTHNIEEDEKKKLKILGSKYFKKFLIKRSRTGKRILPKDSLEVFKKRRIYSKKNSKSKWILHKMDSLDHLACLKRDSKNLSVKKSDYSSSHKVEIQKIEKRASLPECNIVIKQIQVSSRNIVFKENEFAEKLHKPFSRNLSLSKISIGPPNSERSLVSSDKLDNNQSRNSVIESHQLLNVSNLIFRHRKDSNVSNGHKNFYLDFNNDHLDFMSNSDYELRSKNKNSETRAIKLCIKKSKKYASRLNPLGGINKKLSPCNTKSIPSKYDTEKYQIGSDDCLNSRNANNENEACCASCREQSITILEPIINKRIATGITCDPEIKNSPKACPCDEKSHCQIKLLSNAESSHRQCQCPKRINNDFTQNSNTKDSEVEKIAEWNRNTQDNKITQENINRKALNKQIHEEILKSCQRQLQHLTDKLNRLQKCAMNEFLPCHNEDNDIVDIAKLSSEDIIPINFKPSSPSTEEIREIPNCIKLRDQDGITYMERKKCNTAEALNSIYSNEEIEPTLERKCNKLKSPSTETVKGFPDSMKLRDQDGITYIERKKYCADETSKNQYASEVESPLEGKSNNKSDTVKVNNANLVEIHFKLKLKQGDKTTEINIDADKEKQNKQRPKEVYVMKNDKVLHHESKTEPTVDVNGVNVEIYIKNLKAKSDDQIKIERSTNHQNEEFTKSISDKFNAITKSDNILNVNENLLSAYSVNRVEIEPALSKNEISKELVSKSFTHKEEKDENIMSMSQIESQISNAEDSAENIQMFSGISVCQSNQTQQNLNNDTEAIRISLSSDQDKSLYKNATDEEAPKRFHMSQLKYEKKKEMLKKLIKQASKIEKTSDKKKKRQVKDAMKAILTSESELEDIPKMKTNLAKDMTYTNSFRTTDSMNNYYSNEDYFGETDEKESSTMKETTTTASAECISKRCMCTDVAAKLNLNNIRGACCCRRPTKLKRNAVTACNISSQNIWNDYMKYANASTQNSELFISKFVNTKSSFKVVKTEPTDSLQQSNYLSNNCRVSKKPKVSEILTGEIIVMKTEHTNAELTKSEKNKEISLKPSDYLQSFEAKKAVLAIYAEKIKTENGEHFVARLPKYVYEKEIDIQRNYDKLLENRSVLISTRR